MSFRERSYVLSTRYCTGFERNGVLWSECVRKHNGFEEYKIDMTPLSYHELFDKNDIVYLTPDSPTGNFVIFCAQYVSLWNCCAFNPTTGILNDVSNEFSV